MCLYRTPLKAKAIPKLVAKALSALDTLPGAEDMDIIPEAICTHYNLMPWHQASQSMPCKEPSARLTWLESATPFLKSRCHKRHVCMTAEIDVAIVAWHRL